MFTVGFRPLALGAGCLLLLTSPAFAKPAARCPQLVDAQGDQSPSDDAAADLRSVALTSDATSLRLVIRYQGEQEVSTPVSGHVYDVGLGGAVAAEASIAPGGNIFSLQRISGGYSDGGGASSSRSSTLIGRLSGYVDTATHTVHMSVPYALARDVFRPGDRLTVTSAVDSSYAGPTVPVVEGRPIVRTHSDYSDVTANYKLGSLGC